MSTAPGAMALTRTPWAATSCAAARVRAWSAAFEEQSSTPPPSWLNTDARDAQELPMLMMLPRSAATIGASAARMIPIGARTLSA